MSGQVSQRDDHLVDPQLKAALALLPDLSDLSDSTLGEWRARLDPPAEPMQDRADVACEAVTIDESTSCTRFNAMLYRPLGQDGPLPAILSLHGGGFVMGSAERDHPTSLRLASETGCAVLSINYRRAPEHLFPAAIDDAYLQALVCACTVRRVQNPIFGKDFQFRSACVAFLATGVRANLPP